MPTLGGLEKCKDTLGDVPAKWGLRAEGHLPTPQGRLADTGLGFLAAWADAWRWVVVGPVHDPGLRTEARAAQCVAVGGRSPVEWGAAVSTLFSRISR